MILCTFIQIKMKLDAVKKKTGKWKMSPLLQEKKKRKRLFDTVNGKERDQPLFLYFSIEEV